MQKIILMGLAGLIGTLCRYWLSGLVARNYGETFPWGTLVVNVVGCFLAGSLFYLILRLSEDLPMVVEIVDSLEKVEKFLPLLDEMISDGLVTIEKVTAIQYNGGRLSK